MLNMKRRLNPLCQPLAVWDIPYYSHQARANWFKLDIEKGPYLFGDLDPYYV